MLSLSVAPNRQTSMHNVMHNLIQLRVAETWATKQVPCSECLQNISMEASKLFCLRPVLPERFFNMARTNINFMLAILLTLSVKTQRHGTVVVLGEANDELIITQDFLANKIVTSVKCFRKPISMFMGKKKLRVTAKISFSNKGEYYLVAPTAAIDKYDKYLIPSSKITDFGTYTINDHF